MYLKKNTITGTVKILDIKNMNKRRMCRSNACHGQTSNELWIVRPVFDPRIDWREIPLYKNLEKADATRENRERWLCNLSALSKISWFYPKHCISCSVRRAHQATTTLLVKKYKPFITRKYEYIVHFTGTKRVYVWKEKEKHDKKALKMLFRFSGQRIANDT